MLKLKKISLLATMLTAGSLLGISTIANAALPGFYVGGQAGWGDTNYSSSDLGNSTDVSDSGIAGRIFTGYQFNPNWAAELGYTKFSNTTAKNAYGYTGLNLTIKEHAIDLVGKGILPLENGFNAYGKLGAAYLDGDASADYLGVNLANDNDEHKILPTFGVGVSYDVTQNVPVDISWNRIQKMGNTDLKSTDLFSLGVAYNFG